MAQTYNLTHLALNDPSSSDWALAMLRNLLRDVPNQVGAWPMGSYQDEELNAALSLHSLPYQPDPEVAEVKYYRPHAVALALLLGNPDRILQFSASGYSETRNDLQTVRQGIEMQGAAIDDLISKATKGTLPPANLGGLPWGF